MHGADFSYPLASVPSAALSGASVSHLRRGNQFSVAAVPEPGEWAMLVAGLGVMAALERRRRVRAAVAALSLAVDVW